MRETSYPKPIGDVIATLTDICRHQDRFELVELLENSHAHFDAIDYDSWNGGTTTWALRLEVPVAHFATALPRLGEVEKELSDKLGFLDRQFPNNPLGEVTISPLATSEMALGQRMAPSDVDVRRLWRDGCLRLFLSHVSQHKVQVAKLKDELLENGVSAFVAHEDIEPNLEWQSEISLALRSMHALVALVTPDFHNSKWTDQEVGWALGRGLPVLPIRLGADPYGFVGKIQAIPGKLDAPEPLGVAITKALLRSIHVRGVMRSALVQAFERSRSFSTAIRLSKLAVETPDFNESEKGRLISACSTNQQVAGAFGVSERIYAAFGVPKNVGTQSDDDIPF